MNEMVERVARAIAGHNGYDPDDMSGAHNIGGPMWMAFVQEARAAIEAMREPTMDMVVAGTEQWLCEAAMEDRSEANWRAMIDEALRETV
jgi:hypothetical protein